MSGYKKSTFISSNNNNRQTTQLIASEQPGTYTVEHTPWNELWSCMLKVVVLVSAFVLFTMALSIEGEQKGIVKIFRKS